MSPQLFVLQHPRDLTAVAVLVVVAGLLARAAWRHWRLARERRYVSADSLIRAPRQVHTGHDEGLPAQARVRRDRAERYRRAATRLETGSPSSTPTTARVVAMPARRWS